MKKYVYVALCSIFLIFGMVLIFAQKSSAIEIVYPKINHAKINSSSTFFIGSTKPGNDLKINDISVRVGPNGAFAQVVPLKYGQNEFKIVSTPKLGQTETKDDSSEANKPEEMEFVIERAQPAAAPQKTQSQPAKVQELIEYPIINNFYVVKDNAPLRMTPIDAGINRMSHLPKDVQILVNGEKGNFYRVYLNSNLNGWIAKTDVEQREKVQACNTSAIIKSKKYQNSEFYYYEFELEHQVPFMLREENGLTLQIFNISGAPDNTYSLNIPVKKLIGYEAYYQNDCGSQKLILKVRKYPKFNCENPLDKITIVLDPGHGGKEAGAIGGCRDKEKDINLAITKDLQQELLNRGANVIMTRQDDTYVGLSDRVKVAHDSNATFLISIHTNALPDGADPNKNRGTSVYYYYNQAKPLADSILNSMTSELQTKNDQVRQGSLALVRSTLNLSVLIEVAYIINPDDYAMLLDKNFQQNCAKAIADGIQNYLLSN